MLIAIADVLTAEELAEIDALIEAGTFQSGSRTAGWHARLVKNNEQMSGRSAEKAREMVLAALQRNATFTAAALPLRIMPPLIARYGSAMTYGDHIDDPIMRPAGAPPLRTDVSTTVFLSDPDAYEGGELTMETPAGTQTFKLPRGAAVVYPSTTLHRVAPVTAGERRVAVTWTQSMVRDPARREILFDLERSRRAVFDKEGKSEVFDLITKSRANLLRSWAEV